MALEAGRQLQERLEAKDNLSANQLAVIFGITADKLAKMKAISGPANTADHVQELIHTARVSVPTSL